MGTKSGGLAAIRAVRYPAPHGRAGSLGAKRMTLTSTLGLQCRAFRAAGAVLLGLVCAGPAEAAGWSLRAVLGYEYSEDADFSDRDCSSQTPAALFGCARGDDGRPVGGYGDFGSFPMAEVALGKRLLPWLRADLSVGYRFGIAYEGKANFLSVGPEQPISADLDSWNGMLNTFVDLLALSGTDPGRIQPYIGVGVGVAHNRLESVTYRFPQNPRRHKISVTPRGERTNFAYRLVVGTGILISETVTLDLSAYYTDLGEVGTDSGIMAMNNIPAGILIDETNTHLRAVGLGVGLRYAF